LLEGGWKKLYNVCGGGGFARRKPLGLHHSERGVLSGKDKRKKLERATTTQPNPSSCKQMKKNGKRKKRSTS